MESVIAGCLPVLLVFRRPLQLLDIRRCSQPSSASRRWSLCHLLDDARVQSLGLGAEEGPEEFLPPFEDVFLFSSCCPPACFLPRGSPTSCLVDRFELFGVSVQVGVEMLVAITICTSSHAGSSCCCVYATFEGAA